MATYTVSLLADGQLAGAKAAIYTVPAATRVIVSTITLVNENAANRTVNLYILPSGGASRRILPVDMPLEAESMWIHSDEFTLGPGDAIEGDASVAADVDYTISGVEET